MGYEVSSGMNRDLTVALALTVVYLVGIGASRSAAVLLGVAMLYDWCQPSGGGCPGCMDSFDSRDFNERILRSLRMHESGEYQGALKPEGASASLESIESVPDAPPPQQPPTQQQPPFTSALKGAHAKSEFYDSIYSGDALTGRQNPGMHTLSALK
jgi:hypothetical protein